MEIVVLLFLFTAFLIGFKLLALVFKAGVFVLTLPFQIIGAVFGVVFLIMLIPLAVLTGIFASLFAPFLLLGPWLPLLLVLFGVYLIVRSSR